MTDLERRIAEGLRARAEEIDMDVRTVTSRSLELQRRLDGVDGRRRAGWLAAAAGTVLLAGAVAVGWLVLGNDSRVTQVPATATVPTVAMGHVGGADVVVPVGDLLWMAPTGRSVIRAVDPASGRSVGELAVPEAVTQLLPTGSTVYALGSSGERLMTLRAGEQGRPELRASVPLEVPTASIAVSGDGLYGYETDLFSGTAYRIDPTRGTNLGRATLGGGDAQPGSGQPLLAGTPNGLTMATATGVITYSQALVSGGRVDLGDPVLAVHASQDGRVFASTTNAVFSIQGKTSTLLARIGSSDMEWLPGSGRLALVGSHGPVLVDPAARKVTGTTAATDVADTQHLVRSGGELYALTRGGELFRIGSGLGS